MAVQRTLLHVLYHIPIYTHICFQLLLLALNYSS